MLLEPTTANIINDVCGLFNSSNTYGSGPAADCICIHKHTHTRAARWPKSARTTATSSTSSTPNRPNDATLMEGLAGRARKCERTNVLYIAILCSSAASARRARCATTTINMHIFNTFTTLRPSGVGVRARRWSGHVNAMYVVTHARSLAHSLGENTQTENARADVSRQRNSYMHIK